MKPVSESERCHKEIATLCARASDIVSHSSRPQFVVSRYAHSSEQDHWKLIPVHDIRAFGECLFHSNLFILTTHCIAYFLPLMLADCLLRADGNLNHEMLQFVASKVVRASRHMSCAQIEICCEIVSTISQICSSRDNGVAAEFPGLSTIADFENTAILHCVNDIRNRLYCHQASLCD